MSYFDVFLTLLTMLLLSVGQIFFKIVAMNLKENILNVFFNKLFYLAIIIYGMTTILWIYVLNRIPLHKAYFFYGLSFIIVPIFSYFFLREAVTIRTILGSIVIIFGILISVYSR